MIRFLLLLICAALSWAGSKKPAAPPPTPLDRFVQEAEARNAEASAATPGAIWAPASRLADAARDVRAAQLDDLLTIVVAEQASAVTSGTTKTARTSSAKASVSALAGIPKPLGALANLAGLSGDTQLAGQGHHQPQHHPLDHRHCPRRPRPARRRARRRSYQGHPDQLRAPDHHPSRCRPSGGHRRCQQRAVRPPRPARSPRQRQGRRRRRGPPALLPLSPAPRRAALLT